MRPRALWFFLCLALGALPVLPIWIRGSPVLLNDMLVGYYAYFADFHRNWSFAHPLPLWSGSYQCGMPMHAYWQSAQLYPLTWILFGPFDPIHTIYLFYALHFALAIAGFLLLGPELGLIRIASLWGGLAFGWSGTMLARYEHPTFLAGWSYLPLVLGLYLRIERAPSWRGTGLLGLALAMQTLGGHPQATLATVVLSGLFFLRGLTSRKLPKRNLVRPVAAALAAGIVCLPLFLPFLDFLGQADRYDGAAWEGKAAAETGAGEKLAEGVFGFEKFSTGGLRPFHLLSLAWPRALGTPAHATWWGGEPWGEVFLFIGSAGILACLFASFRRASARLRWLWICGLIGLWLAFGAHLYASQIQYHLPILNNFRRPARWGILFVLALAALSAHGFQRWLGGRSRPKVMLWLGGAGLAGFLAAMIFSVLPDGVRGLLEIARSVKPDSAKDYSGKVLGLMRDWRIDFLFFTLVAGAFALRSRFGSRRLVWPLLILLAADLLRLHWAHFHPFPRGFYRTPPRTLETMDLSTRPFWRVEHYLEYPGDEMWRMHHDPMRRFDLFEREKLALGYGIHAVFGIRHAGAHMPLLWPWDSALTPGGKSARYLLSNRDLTRFHGSPLESMARYDSVRVYAVVDWKPRLELLPSKTAPGDSSAPDCPAGFSGYGRLCVSEPRDGTVAARGDFHAGDTLVFREHWHRGWRVRAEGGEWGRPGRYRGVFMARVFDGAAREAEWRF